MSNIMQIIANETKGKSFRTYKYSFDSVGVPSFDYDDNYEIKWKKIGETTKFKNAIDLEPLAKRIENDTPLFTYFLDGSRRVFKVDDIAYNKQVFPVIAGQVGIGCCKRIDKQMKPQKFEKSVVIVLPEMAWNNGWKIEVQNQNLLRKVNDSITSDKFTLKVDDIKTYPCRIEKGSKLENKGIEIVQNLMVDKEKGMVAYLTSKNLLSTDNYLLKDGSLEYRTMATGNYRELHKIMNNYRWVIGASKSFNPEKCVDNTGRNNSNYIADLKNFHRTPVYMYESEMFPGVTFGIWYVRIHEKRFTNNAFAGILKLERILVTEKEQKEGLDSEEVDMITANIINERNPVCYGTDARWANHLYPVFLTESYVKSKYISNELFMNIF